MPHETVDMGSILQDQPQSPKARPRRVKWWVVAAATGFAAIAGFFTAAIVDHYTPTDTTASIPLTETLSENRLFSWDAAATIEGDYGVWTRGEGDAGNAYTSVDTSCTIRVYSIPGATLPGVRSDSEATTAYMEDTGGSEIASAGAFLLTDGGSLSTMRSAITSSDGEPLLMWARLGALSNTSYSAVLGCESEDDLATLSEAGPEQIGITLSTQ